MPENNGGRPLLKVKPIVYDTKNKMHRPALPDDAIDGLEPQKADLTLQAISHRKCLFWFIIIISGVMFLIYIIAFIVLFFCDINRMKQLCDATSLALIPLSLLIITPVTMVLTLLHKLYRPDKKTDDDEVSTIPQLEAIEKAKDAARELLKDIGLIK